jgi:hypothetical protein
MSGQIYSPIETPSIVTPLNRDSIARIQHWAGPAFPQVSFAYPCVSGWKIQGVANFIQRLVYTSM